MKFLSVELGAIDELVSNRFLQSTDFPQGQILAAMLKGQLPTAELSSRLIVTRLADGLFVTLPSLSTRTRCLVVDVEASKIFDEFSDADCLFMFQKLIRFAKKAWQGLAFNFSERYISGSTKALLFPFRGFKPAPFRLALERDPWGDRLEKRGDKGNFLLVYKAGYDGAEAAKEQPELTNFRKAYESIPELKQALRADISQQGSIFGAPQQRVTELLADPRGGGSMYRSFEDWMPLLTKQQRDFVESPIEGASRIEGAAGTGKTLALMLRAIFALRKAQEAKEQFHAVFVTHSDATKRTIAEVLSVIDYQNFSSMSRDISSVSLKICTLSELCASELRQSISQSEFIDRDAMESKGLQLIYINEALNDSLADDLKTHERFLSGGFLEFLKSADKWRISEMIQHEISVMIKGRASDSLDAYKKIPALKYGIPVETDSDKGFVFAIFRRYQAKLGDVGQFDTDDVVLTTIGQLDTPIWRRRRARDGYDCIFIDETHLFNINELHVFHYFTKIEGPYPIVYSVDRSQAVGDRGWTVYDIEVSLVNSQANSNSIRAKTIFRSSTDIINLAFSVVSSGATLFTNFDNPLNAAASGFTEQEERLCKQPVYLNAANDNALIEGAFDRADVLSKEMSCRRSDVLIVTLDETILELMEKFAAEKNKPYTLLKQRGDAKAVESARQASHFVIAHADYVGGLEFAGVILVGIDAGRVPPAAGDGSNSSRNYLSYAAHNRLYVSVTRAKYRVEILGEKARGPSPILIPAIKSDLLMVEDLQ